MEPPGRAKLAATGPGYGRITKMGGSCGLIWTKLYAPGGLPGLTDCEITDVVEEPGDVYLLGVGTVTMDTGAMVPFLLRVLKALAAVARYCGRNAGSLFLLVWFPCLMVGVCQIALDWLSLSFPPKLPAWLLSQNFNPPTLLTAAAETPWGAMAWAFVLADMSNRNTRRGVTSALASLRARFELSVAVLAAATIFTTVNLVDGGLRALQLQLLASIAATFELTGELLLAIGKTGEIVQVIVMAAVPGIYWISSRSGAVAAAE